MGDEKRPRRAALVVPWAMVECLETAVRKDSHGAKTLVHVKGGSAYWVIETVEEIVGSVPGVRTGQGGVQREGEEMRVPSHHPLMELLGGLLLGIEGVPADEQRKMVNRACKGAVKWHEDRMKRAAQEAKKEKP